LVVPALGSILAKEFGRISHAFVHVHGSASVDNGLVGIVPSSVSACTEICRWWSNNWCCVVVYWLSGIVSWLGRVITWLSSVRVVSIVPFTFISVVTVGLLHGLAE